MGSCVIPLIVSQYVILIFDTSVLTDLCGQIFRDFLSLLEINRI
jgi:hypothetical protein